MIAFVIAAIAMLVALVPAGVIMARGALADAVIEATRLGIDSDELIALIKECSNEREGVAL